MFDLADSDYNILSNIPKSILEANPVKTFEQDQLLFKKGCPVDYVYYVCSGRVCVYSETVSGKISKVVYVVAGETVGEMEILANAEIMCYTAITYTKSEILKIHKSDFLKWIRTDPEFCLKMVQLLAVKLHTAANSMCRYLEGDAMHLVMHYIIENVRDELAINPHVKISHTRLDIADNCGICERTVTRCLKKLKEQKLIDVIAGKITISREQLALLISSKNLGGNHEKDYY